MSKLRTCLVGAIVAATALAGTPADAHTSVRLVAGGSYTGVVANGLTVTYACTAAGVGDIVSVAITECYITTSADNASIALPGPTATIGGVTTVPFAPFRLCYKAVFTFLDAHATPVSGCNPLAPTVAGFPQLVGAGVTTV